MKKRRDLVHQQDMLRGSNYQSQDKKKEVKSRIPGQDTEYTLEKSKIREIFKEK